MFDYIAKAAAAWLLGFAPFLEIYIAVPAAMGMGLDSVSAVVWSVFGNFVPVLLIVFAYDRLTRIERIRNWLASPRIISRSQRFERSINRYGPWFVLFITPWVGIWVVAATARILGMHQGTLVLFSFISIAVYGTLIAAAISLGFDFAGETAPG